jgi:hypothetical protein
MEIRFMDGRWMELLLNGSLAVGGFELLSSAVPVELSVSSEALKLLMRCTVENVGN